MPYIAANAATASSAPTIQFVEWRRVRLFSATKKTAA
jgi:hypothetical protein